jgi:hypothetical protein
MMAIPRVCHVVQRSWTFNIQQQTVRGMGGLIQQQTYWSFDKARLLDHLGVGALLVVNAMLSCNHGKGAEHVGIIALGKRACITMLRLLQNQQMFFIG